MADLQKLHSLHYNRTSYYAGDFERYKKYRLLIEMIDGRYTVNGYPGKLAKLHTE